MISIWGDQHTPPRCIADMSSTRWLTFPLLVALALALGTLAVSAQNVTSTGSQSFSATPVSTTVPSPTGSLDAPIPGQGQYPALQRECAKTMTDRLASRLLRYLKLLGERGCNIRTDRHSMVQWRHERYLLSQRGESSSSRFTTVT